LDLLLVRHAIAFERNARRWPDDGQRPLTPAGSARARRAAAGLKQLVAAPSLVLVSPLVRARQTAQLLTRHANWPQATVCSELEPDTAPQQLLALLARQRGASMAVVGHEPDLGRLLSICLTGAGDIPFSFRKMGVACVTFRGVARAGSGELTWFMPPKLLRAARAG
jgi:phosphohistidine phosphatase